MIDLYTVASPNGWKISVTLEEMGLPYRVCSLPTSERKGPTYLAINPNGRVPAIVDRGADDFAVFETGAIMIYLAEASGMLLPSSPKGRSQVIQWLMWQMAGIGPMMGQSNVFNRYYPTHVPEAADRYKRECRRLFEVLDTRLRDHEFLVDDYSIADIATWCWVRIYPWAKIPADDLIHVQRWLRTIADRPAVQRGVAVPYDRPVMVFDQQHLDHTDEHVRTMREGRAALGFASPA